MPAIGFAILWNFQLQHYGFLTCNFRYFYLTTNNVTRGQDQRGKPIIKTIWELDPDTSPVVREIIIELFTNKQLSYRLIRDELNNRGIPGPTGSHWGSPTLVELLKENRLEQYAGTAYWNKEDKHTLGKKYKPFDEWIKAENAHPPIITVEELKAALEKKKQNKYTAPDGATRESSYLLTGNNFEGKPLFKCGNCGGNVVGYGNSSYKWKKYICGVNRSKGTVACDSKWLIERDWLEEIILNEIDKRYTAPKKVDVLIKDISGRVNNKNKEIDKSINILQSQIRNVVIEIKRLLEAIKLGVDPSIVSEEINSLKLKRDGLEENIVSLKNARTNASNIVDIEALKNFFLNFKTAFDNAAIKERRQLVRTFVRHIELAPETKEIRVEFYPDQVVQSIGAGDRT